ncbi:hypothetical protein [Aquibacillus rhizosphaerae]|uniref:Uncharacterized protein n=1 Tax=Aquibacillus rhizosphaerae TaxID=3051431 RepID=A0ABT7L3H6_9BACI|nr:hypothetical protein [Aquibacillus sp. LR5S19]MDL4840417.1 hypothetical protein [Aquibacillus sp. LR5S19]
MNPSICRYCYKEIENRDQLVTATNMLRVRSYHYVCFNEIETETKTFWGFWTPINGVSGNIRSVIMLGLALWMFFTNSLGAIGDLIGIIALFSSLLRGISYFFYERKLPAYKHK